MICGLCTRVCDVLEKDWMGMELHHCPQCHILYQWKNGTINVMFKNWDPGMDDDDS